MDWAAYYGCLAERELSQHSEGDHNHSWRGALHDFCKFKEFISHPIRKISFLHSSDDATAGRSPPG